MTDQLFDGYPDPEPAPDPYAGMGQDARRTAKQRELIADGFNPATRLPLANNGETCGTCIHLLTKDIGSGRWFKCEQQIHGPYAEGLDIRKSWPACTQWQAITS